MFLQLYKCFVIFLTIFCFKNISANENKYSYPSIHLKNNKNSLCVLEKINKIDDIFDQIRLCSVGDKILINYGSGIAAESLIAQLCDLKFSIIFDKDNKIVNTRNVSKKIVCIYNPTLPKKPN